MGFENIRGNEALLQRLRQTIQSENIPHAWLIEAPASVNKASFATAFAQALLCQEKPGVGCGSCPLCRRIAEGSHLDITRIGATGKGDSTMLSVRDEAVKQLQDRLSKKPVEGARSMAIIENADSMTPRACNRFLKTLEEPAPGTVILLLVENANSLPATIRSRCIQIRLNPWEDQAILPCWEDAQRILSLLLDCAPYYALKEASLSYGEDRQKAYQLLDALEEAAGARLGQERPFTERQRLYRIIEACEGAGHELRRGDRPATAIRKMLLTAGGR